MQLRLPTALQLFVVFDGDEAMLGPDPDVMARQFRAAVLSSVQTIKATWVTVAKGMGVDRNGDYVAGITAEGNVSIVRETMGDAFVEIVIAISNTAQHADIIEEGHPAFSLPRAINWAKGTPRMKRTAKGKRYLHIPFRHFAHADPEKAAAQGLKAHTLKHMLPQDIYQRAKRLRRRQAISGPVYAPSGQFLQAHRYQWTTSTGAKRLDHNYPIDVHKEITPGQPDHTTIPRRGYRFVGIDREGNDLHNPTWASSKFDGLMKTGPPRHTRYLTVRTLTEDSQGWNIPAREGKHIVRRLSDSLGTGRLGEAVQKAIRAHMPLAGLDVGPPGGG